MRVPPHVPSVATLTDAGQALRSFLSQSHTDMRVQHGRRDYDGSLGAGLQCPVINLSYGDGGC